MPPEELYQAFNRAIESVNVVVATYSDEAMGDLQVSPEAGTIAFGSGLHQWAFTLSRFAKIYAEKFGIEEDKMTERMTARLTAVEEEATAWQRAWGDTQSISSFEKGLRRPIEDHLWLSSGRCSAGWY